MAETVDYSNVPSIAVIYEGTLNSFNSLEDKSEYYGRVVFITGSTATNATAEEKQQAIWVSGDNGNNAHFLNMSDAATIAAQLQYVKGIKVGNTEYPTVPGGTFLTLAGTQIEIKVDTVTGTITFDASSIYNLASQANSTAATANASANAALGSIATMWGSDATSEKSIRAIAQEEAKDAKDYADGIVDDLVEGDTFVKPDEIFSNNKIKTDLLPDVILGQLTFGGTLTYNITATDGTYVSLDPSEDFTDRYKVEDFAELPSSSFPNGNKNGYPKFNSNNYKPKDFKNVYFIVTGEMGFTLDFDQIPQGETTFAVGDWCLSNGLKWAKIDNTDAVTTVVGQTGEVTFTDITGRTNEAKETIGASLDKADSSIQGLKAGKADKLTWADDGYITVGVLEEGSAYIPNQGRTGTIHANTETIGNAISDTSKKGLATAEDIAVYLKARLSVKVVTN